jgi:threonine/homoserine/homoserine lactone efflux protein
MPGFSLLSFSLFCLAVTVTPGPNNMINLAQGVRLGFWRALPFALGTGFGIGSLLIASGLGLGAAFRALPWLNLAMRGAALVFLLYLSWKIAASGPLQDRANVDRLGFLSGIGFQWVNPKTWASSITMVSTYLTSGAPVGDILVMGSIFCAIGWMAQPVWIGFGTALRRLVANPRYALAFNVAMGALLLASTLPSLLLGN